MNSRLYCFSYAFVVGGIKQLLVTQQSNAVKCRYGSMCSGNNFYFMVAV